HCNNPDTKAELQAFKESELQQRNNIEAYARFMRTIIRPSLPLPKRQRLLGSSSSFLPNLVCLNKDGLNVTKEKARSLLKELKLPFALFHGGLWVEYIPFFLGYNFKEGVMNVVGEGDAKMSIVARSDLSRFIAHVLVEALKAHWSDRGSQLRGVACPRRRLLHLPRRSWVKRWSSSWGAMVRPRSVPVAYILTRIPDGRCVSGTVGRPRTLFRVLLGLEPDALRDVHCVLAQ
ncbi:hypothetical protein PI125_g10063, partial [Phytophthora idaei]